MKKKIYFLDSWSVGFQIIEPVIKALCQDKFDLYFVHFDSLIKKYPDKLFTSNIIKSNAYLKKSKICKGIDLSKYNFSAVDFFKNEEPDLLVFISIHNLEQRYFLNIAKHFNTRTMLVMHGLILDHVIINKKSIFKKLLYPITKFNRLRYYTKLYRIYFEDLNKLRKVNFNVLLYLKILVFREKYVNTIDKSESFTLDSICMINKKDRLFYSKYYNQNKTKYKLVGHLDNHRLINYFESNKKEIFANSENNVIFFSQPLVADGTLSFRQYYKSLNLIKKSCDKLGLNLVLRPHPRDDKNVIDKLKNNLKINISNKLIEEDLFRSKIVIGINSTVLVSANYINKNILIIDFGFANDFTAISPKENRNVKVVKYNDEKGIEKDIKFFSMLDDFPNKDQNIVFKNPVDLIKKEIFTLLNS